MATTNKTQQKLPAKVLKYCTGSWESSDIDLSTADDITGLPNKCYLFITQETYIALGDVCTTILPSFTAPNLVKSETCGKSNGYFGCQGIYNKNEKLESYSTWFRCLIKMVVNESYMPVYRPYTWYEMTFFTQWNHLGLCRVLCVNTPNQLQLGLSTNLQNIPYQIQHNDPFALHTSLFSQITVLYDESIWKIRNLVRKFEKERLSATPNFEDMHEVSRHAIHTTEVLSVTLNTLERFRGHQKLVYELQGTELGLNFRMQAQENTSFLLELLKAFKLRSESIHARLQNEITLSYNSLARQDNIVVKAIAILTTLFLPATFFAAFFSTTFFTFGEKEWGVSNKLWIYWGTTVPSTILVAGICVLWVYRPIRNPFTSSLWKGFSRGSVDVQQVHPYHVA
ncbi:hypothetical protein FQN57_003711 [Myotisia sp. PD_48]|nr:hypothetical protein FQN57_003711 [Myotisia sp. PD_48]